MIAKQSAVLADMKTTASISSLALVIGLGIQPAGASDRIDIAATADSEEVIEAAAAAPVSEEIIEAAAASEPVESTGGQSQSDLANIRYGLWKGIRSISYKEQRNQASYKRLERGNPYC